MDQRSGLEKGRKDEKGWVEVPSEAWVRAGVGSDSKMIKNIGRRPPRPRPTPLIELGRSDKIPVRDDN